MIFHEYEKKNNGVFFHILLFFILFVSVSYVVHAFLSGVLMIAIMLCLVVLGLLYRVVLDNRKDNTPLSIRTFIISIAEFVKEYSTALIVYIFLLIFSAISMLINRNKVHFYLILWIMMGIGLLCAVVFDRRHVFRILTNIMVALSLFSLLTYFLYHIAPNFVSRFPLVTNKAGGRAYNLLFSVVFPVNQGLVARNFGLFWEPGAYQSFLNLALLIELFLLNRRAKPFYAIVLYITIQTTFSTAGIIISNITSIIYIASVILGNRRNLNRVLQVRTMIIVLIGLLASIGWFYQAPAIYQEAGYGKLLTQIKKMVVLNQNQENEGVTKTGINESEIQTDLLLKGTSTDVEDKNNFVTEDTAASGLFQETEQSPGNKIDSLANWEEKTEVSGQVIAGEIKVPVYTHITEPGNIRNEDSMLSDDKSNISNDEFAMINPQQAYEAGRISAFIFPFRAFCSSPVTGVGYEHLTQLAIDAGYRFNTFTIINWFAENGVLFGLLLCLAFACMFLISDHPFWLRLVLIIPLFASFVTEQYERNAMLYVIIFSSIPSRMPLRRRKKVVS